MSTSSNVPNPASPAASPRPAAANPPIDGALLSPEFLARLEQMELVSRKIFRGRMKGERRSKRRGQSVEFADFRNYVVGDDLRHIDWNSYARLDKLFLKLFLEEEDLHFYTLIDNSLSMDFGSPSKLRYGLQVAAALGFIGLVNADRVRIETVSQPAKERGAILRGRANLWRMFEHLESIQPQAATVSLAQGVKNFCIRNPGQGIVVLVSDMMDKQGYEDALRYLVGRSMDIYLIHVLSPAELDPDVTGDLRLVDCEDGDVAEVTISGALIKKYKQTLNAYVGGLRDYCNRRGIVYMLANTQQPFEQLVTNYLRTRGLVR